MAETAPVHADSLPAESGGGYPEPFQSRMGQCEWKRLGDPFGLTQFGISLETLQPGAQSALRHWHTLSDEFLYLLEGELVLRMNAGEMTLTPGMCVGFKAGTRDGHHFVNRSDRPARYLILGSRVPGGSCFYPDDDLMWVNREDGSFPAHKDGTPYWLPTGSPEPSNRPVKELEPPKILGLRTVIYPVTDLTRGKAWYAGVLGVAPYFDQPFYVGFSVGGFELGLVPDGTPGPDGSVAYWGVADAAAAFAQLKAAGATVREAPHDVGEGIKVASVLDPFGNTFAIIENPHFSTAAVR